MKRVLCYGDSNTFGHNPEDMTRLPYTVRWPGVLSGLLGSEWQVIEEGLCGRTISREDPASGGRNGLNYLEPCLYSHFPLDWIVFMLGTNDLQCVYSAIPQTVAQSMGRMLDEAEKLIRIHNLNTKILLVSPILIGDTSHHPQFCDLFPKGRSDVYSQKLAALYKIEAERRGCAFLDASQVAYASEIDGLHMDPENHRKLAEAVFKMISM